MKVKSKKEFQDLDEELNLFEESEWDFLHVEDHEENFEFFEDVPDIDFNDKANKIKQLIPFIGIIAVILFQGIWLGSLIIKRDAEEYLDFKTSLNTQSKVQYVDGSEVSGDVFIDINKMLANYFRVLQSKTGYDSLDNYCLTESTFKSEYNNSLSKMSSSYDKYDCNARSISEFGGYLQLNKISKAIEKDGTYYIYCDITVPAKEDIYEYIHLFSYNLTKYFTGNEVNEQNVVRFLLETMAYNPIPTTTTTFCFEVVNSDKGYVIVDDSDVLNTCKTAYNYSVSQMTKILGNNLVDESM